MSKQVNHTVVSKIYEMILEKKNFDKGLFDLIREMTNDSKDEIIIANEIINMLSENGYEIENANPLKIKEI